MEGIVRLSSKNTSRGKKVITIETPTGELVDHLVPMNKHVIVHEDDHVHLGDQLTEGPVSPEEILDVCGKESLQEHLVNEVQEVYRLQGVEINDKHVEIIVRQMLRKVVITEPGNTEFLWGDQVDKTTFDRINEQTVAQGGQPGRGQARSARHHEGLPGNGILHLRGILPGYHARFDGSLHPRQDRYAGRLQGERHHGPPYPCRHRFLPV